MKAGYSFVIVFLFLVLAGCQKENGRSFSSRRAGLLEKQLADSLSAGSFSQVNFDAVYYNGEGPLQFVRIGFHGKSISEEFILLRVDESGRLLEGRKIHIATVVHGYTVDGKISIDYLNDVPVIH
ncbi:MAG: hypothetical protein ABUT20_62285, partial [Bacteroidota bacterium]